MRSVIAACCLAVCAAETPGAEENWLGWLSPGLRALDQQQLAAQQELVRLGAPVIGQTVPQFGYQHPRVTTPPLTPPWVQIDLQAATAIDTIALVPAVLDWQSDTKRTYGFPPRLRVDVADQADFAAPTLIAEIELTDPGIAPVIVRAGGRTARYVRITVLTLAKEAGQYFYALGEVMVISGQRNLACGRPVTASKALELSPRWTLLNLVDGRTPLGPPIQLELLKWDGLFAGAVPDEPFTAMRLDLGTEQVVQEVRLYAVHARLGADIPGFSFPKRFRVEAALSADYADAVTLFDTGANDFPNPGDNPVVIRAADVRTRHLRVALPPGDQTRFGLSEIEVYAGDRNVARQATVSATRDPSGYSGAWPKSLLVDGFTSYGRLKELPVWIDEWERRTQLGGELARLDQQREQLLAIARRRAWWLGGGLVGALLLAGIGFGIVVRRRRLRELQVLRTRLARDLHDEIGSNLAAIAMLSELGGGEGGAHAGAPTAAPATPGGDWQEVNRIAHESMDGMREVLWLVGARDEAGPEPIAQLKRVAERMLAGSELHWTAPERVPGTWRSEARRELFLFMKEALNNIARHASAPRVDIDVAIDDAGLRLVIRDHGRGFIPEQANSGIGLPSLRNRARILGGRFVLTSAPGAGTTITLTVPLANLAAGAAGGKPAGDV